MINQFLIYDNRDEVTEELFESLLDRYQTGLKTSMGGSDFIFDFSIYCITNAIKNPNPCGSYIVPPDWKKSKKLRINSIN